MDPPRITVPPDNTTGDLYGRVVLTCEASGTPQPRVTWFKDGREVTDRDQDEYSYVIRELSLSDRGFYQCQARSVGQDGTVQMTEKTRPAVVNIKGKRGGAEREREREKRIWKEGGREKVEKRQEEREREGGDGKEIYKRKWS